MAEPVTSEGRSFTDPMQDLGEGLYAFSAAGPMRLYVLTLDAPTVPAPLMFQTFLETGFGWAMFTLVDLSKLDVAAFAVQARAKLPPISPSTNYANAFVWLESADQFDDLNTMLWQYTSDNVATGNSDSNFASHRIAVDINAQIGSLQYEFKDRDGATPPVMTLLTGSTNVALLVDGDPQTVGMPVNPARTGSSAWVCQVAFDGPQTGSLAMPLALDIGTLADQFGFETTFQYDPVQMSDEAPCGVGLETLRMPFFPPQALKPTDQGALCALNVLINPFQPSVPEASGIRIDRAGRLLSGTDPAANAAQAKQISNARALTSPYAASSNGSVLALTPADPLDEGLPFDAFVGGGFAYSPATKGADTTTPMTPAGVFDPTADSGAVDLMPGLFALDFVRLAAGDRLLFTTQHPAYIPPRETVQQGAMQSTMTTSYVSVLLGQAASGRGYFGQSSTANLYLTDEDAGAGLLSAALAQLSPLNNTPAFPMIFVGAVFLAHPDNGPYNPTATAGLIARLDQKAIGPQRHSVLLDAPDGPKVQLPPSIDARMRSAEITTHPVITPQGYIVDVDENGIFTDITLGVGTGDAISPNALRFNGAGEPKKVSPEISTLLTRENLFMVATKSAPTWNFQDRIMVAGFEFAVTLDGAGSVLDDDTLPAILIVKLDPRRSLYDMALDPTSWTNGGEYVDGVEDVTARLTAFFKTAENPNSPEGEDPFGAFRLMMRQKSWTGVIAFDAPIDGNGMPSDLQMLLGGIPGQLRAHHVGIQTSKVSADEVAQSSVFGVINYQRDKNQPPSGNDPEYEVAELIAQISNSALVQLHVTVDLIVKQLLGREMSLPVTKENPNGDTLRIKGQYQMHGDVGRVTFTTDDPFIFTPDIAGEGITRVIESVHVTHASLVPVGSTQAATSDLSDSDDTPLTHVAAHFTLDGQIFFNSAPFPNADGLDLFSYGQDLAATTDKKQGLTFAGLAVSIDFDLDENGTLVAGSKLVEMLEDQLTPAPTPLAVRPQSLLESLPMQLSGFEVADPTSDTKIGGKATAVNVLQLMAKTAKGTVPPVSSDDPNPVEVRPPPTMPVSPYTTTSPAYGLNYNISLGSLGELSGAHAGLAASLILGWGPSPTVPDNDAACVMIALPSLSAGYQGFDLQGFISTKFQGANLLKVDLEDGSAVYALSFDNVQLAVFGYGLPPGVLIDFLLFSGNAADAKEKVTDASSIGWLLSATTDKPKGESV